METSTMPKLITQLKRRIEVKRDVDTDVNAYVNKDTRPLPPSRRTYGPWAFVGLWMVCSLSAVSFPEKGSLTSLS